MTALTEVLGLNVEVEYLDGRCVIYCSFSWNKNGFNVSLCYVSLFSTVDRSMIQLALDAITLVLLCLKVMQI